MTREECTTEMVKDNVKELYDKFQMHHWDEKTGWMPDHRETIKTCLKVVDILIDEQTMWQNGEPNPEHYWQKVKKELIKSI